ncbi:MAG: phytoene desaturase family protein [Planctomycetota bacterium]
MPRSKRTHSSARPSVGIIGAGPGGLSTAVLLAARGADVTVYESQDTVGGRTARITLDRSPDGAPVGPYHFDRGPTFFMMPYVLEEVFTAAGRKLSDYAELRELDPMYRLMMGREGQSPVVLDTTRDLDLMAERLGAIDASDGLSFRKFIDDNRAKLDAFEPVLRSPMRTPMDLVNLETMGSLPHLNPHLTVHSMLGRYFNHPLVKLAVCFQSKYLGMSPYECPSLFTILPFIEYEYGIWHPVGGCNALMQAMAELTEELGGAIRTSSPVDEVVFDGKRAAGVMTKGEVRAHDYVVCNADATWAMKNLIPEHLRTNGHSDGALDDRRYSCSTYMLYLGVRGTVDLPHHTIYTSERYRENLDDIAVNGALSEDPSTYICNPVGVDPSLAPEGDSALYVLVPTPNLKADVDWSVEAPRMRERTMEQIRTKFGIEDIEERIQAEMQITPADWAGSNINFGATFNLAHNLTQMLHLRPQNKLKGFEGLFLTGGGTHPGSGLPTIFLSAQIAARLIGEEAGLPTFAAEPELAGV